MTSAATEREIGKWRLWGINKFLESNSSLSLKQEKNGHSPTLGLVGSIYHKSEDEVKELLEDARSSLKDMDIGWAIFGACDFLNQFPLRTSRENGHMLLKHSDVFRTFGKKDSQGRKLHTEATEAYLRFNKVRNLNNLPIHLFVKDYIHSESMEYTLKVGHESGLDTHASLSVFDVLAFILQTSTRLR